MPDQPAARGQVCAVVVTYHPDHEFPARLRRIVPQVGTTFIDTLVVTNGVALYGIGNRPGRWDFRSGPRFPYGRRIMALPVWAHRRGVLSAAHRFLRKLLNLENKISHISEIKAILSSSTSRISIRACSDGDGRACVLREAKLYLA